MRQPHLVLYMGGGLASPIPAKDRQEGRRDPYSVTMAFPIADITINPALLLLLGLLVGVMGGFFGVGGGFLVVGGLLVFGVPTDFAIGTGLTLIMGSSIINLLNHRRLGNVDLRLGLLLVSGSVPALFGGDQIVNRLRSAEVVDPVIRCTYVAFLAGVGLFILRDYWKTGRSADTSGEEISTAKLADRVRSLNIPPGRIWLAQMGWRSTYISLPVSGIDRISVFIPISLGVGVGFVAGLLGVGGGFILLPILIFLLGIPTVMAAGTGLLHIAIVGSAGSFIKALSGSVDPMMAVMMLATASMGAQLGVAATELVRASKIRAMFGVAVLSGSLAVGLKQAAESVDGSRYLNGAATGVLLGVSGAICALIAVIVVVQLRERRRGPHGQTLDAPDAAGLGPIPGRDVMINDLGSDKEDR